MMDDANGPRFGEQLAALANNWNQRFGKKAPPFFFTWPAGKVSPDFSLLESPFIVDAAGLSIGKKNDFGSFFKEIIRKISE